MTSAGSMRARGVFVVIEGSDGSGKGTQSELLAKALRQEGYDVAAFDFPQYEQPSSYFVRKYLNGGYGKLDEVGPYTSSLFYALDRFEASKAIRQALGEGKVVLANRYTGSNMAHQGTKFAYSEERRGYYIWLDNLEFQVLKVPRPDMNFVLRVPAEIAQNLIDQKHRRGYTDKKRDLHEADLEHLKKSVQVYDEMCQLFPRDFTRIDCVRSGKLMDTEAIHKILLERIRAVLPEKPVKPAKSADSQAQAADAQTNQNPYLEKDNGIITVTAAGQDFLESCVTDATGNVYAFNDKLSPITIAAAMARLSRRADDMRITILDEFAAAMGKDESLLKRVISAYGDDSVQQLAGIHMVVEDASNLLTKKLERGRLAAYLEQSTRYIYYDAKDKNGRYKYFIPSNLDKKTKASYCQVMDKIFELYSLMARKMTDHVQAQSAVPESERDAAWRAATRAQACDAARAVLPVATKSTVGIFASGQALESLIMRLLSDDLHEARQTGQKILDEARKVMPAFLERADKPERGGATAAYRAGTRHAVQALADAYIADSYADGSDDEVELTDFWPRNELDLLPDMLYEHSNLSLKRLDKEIESWPYERKVNLLNCYIGERLNRRHRPGRALEKAHYSWDILCDYGIFRDLQRHRMVDALEWQQLTPRYGFNTPKLIDEAGLSSEFELCFDLSLKLHSLLQAAGYPLEAQYATLLGHKMRWKVTYNARQAFHLHELRTSPQGHPEYRRIVNLMHDKLSEVHPLLAGAMKFVNRDEDPELTRLAAERYSQYKLRQL